MPQARGAPIVRNMGRIILSIAGVVLAIWVVMLVVGAFISMLKTFLLWGVIAVVVMLVVTLIAKGKSGKGS